MVMARQHPQDQAAHWASQRAFRSGAQPAMMSELPKAGQAMRPEQWRQLVRRLQRVLRPGCGRHETAQLKTWQRALPACLQMTVVASGPVRRP